MGRPDRNFFAPTVPGTVAALARAWHRWVGWERGHGQQLPLECGAARDHPGGVGGPPFPLSSWCPAGMGHPGMGLSCAWFPYGAKGHAGMLLIPAPPSLRTDPGAGWGGGSPKVPSRAEQRGGAGGRICPVPVPVPIPGPSPSLLSPPAVSLLVAEVWGGEDPILSPTPLTPTAPHSITSHPPGRASGYRGAPKIQGPRAGRWDRRQLGGGAQLVPPM